MAGVNENRFALAWASAAEAPLYVELITKFTKKIKTLGPLGKAEGISLEELKSRLGVVRAAAVSVKLRMRFARLAQELRNESDYSLQAIEARMSEDLDEFILREIRKQ